MTLQLWSPEWTRRGQVAGGRGRQGFLFLTTLGLSGWEGTGWDSKAGHWELCRSQTEPSV